MNAELLRISPYFHKLTTSHQSENFISREEQQAHAATLNMAAGDFSGLLVALLSTDNDVRSKAEVRSELFVFFSDY